MKHIIGKVDPLKMGTQITNFPEDRNGDRQHRLDLCRADPTDLFFTGTPMRITPGESQLLVPVLKGESRRQYRLALITDIIEYTVTEVNGDQKQIEKLCVWFKYEDDPVPTGMIVLEPSPVQIMSYRSALAVNFVCSIQTDDNSTICDYFKSHYGTITHLDQLYYYESTKVITKLVDFIDEAGCAASSHIVTGVWVFFSTKQVPVNTDLTILDDVICDDIRHCNDGGI